MKIIRPSVQIEYLTPNACEVIEAAARTCYQSHDITDSGSAERLTKTLLKSGHHTPIEFCTMNLRFIIDRGISHELVRHRVASYCQESSRYCNYSKNKFGNELTFIAPWWTTENILNYEANLLTDAEEWFIQSCRTAEKDYLRLLTEIKPQDARGCLPNWLKTEVKMHLNFREARLMLSQRTASGAHPDMRIIMTNLLGQLQRQEPIIFGGLL